MALTQSTDPNMDSLLAERRLIGKRVEKAAQQLEAPSQAIPFLTRIGAYSALYFIREGLEIVLTVIIFLIIIKEGFGELRLIPSESMVPTLQVGDRLFIEKMTRFWRPYQRGDVLVFYPPEPLAVLPHDPVSLFLRSTGFSALVHNTAEDPVDKAFIKRVVGLPGETVQVVNNVGVYIDGRLLDEPFVNEVANHCMQDKSFCQPRKIPEGHYFLMGDNRNNSKDSRTFGFEPKDRIVGRAVFRILPVERIGTLDEHNEPNGRG